MEIFTQTDIVGNRSKRPLMLTAFFSDQPPKCEAKTLWNAGNTPEVCLKKTKPPHNHRLGNSENMPQSCC